MPKNVPRVGWSGSCKGGVGGPCRDGVGHAGME